MSDIDGRTPILVGVGQVSERPGEEGYRKLSPTDLAAEAAKEACVDALSLARLAPQIDAIFSVRTVADSVPAIMRAQRAPFGTPSNVPAAVAARIGASPRLAVYSPACGDEPQKLVGEACERLYAGEVRMVLLCGGEAESTQRAAMTAGEKLDWSELHDAPLEERHSSVIMRTKHMTAHGLTMPTTIYPLLENARRARLGVSREAYAMEMGRLLSPFSRVAENNPHAASRKVRGAEEIAVVEADNRMIADPHPRSVVARDQVNQGAALLLTTVATARELDIPQSRWVYLHGYSAVDERAVLERQDLGASEAMTGAYQQALESSGVKLENIRYMDIYSCFPIAVFAALDALGLRSDDPRGLTLTGGLPYFGGPGNNYSMHGIAELVLRLRADPGAYGMVGANGGFMNTHAVGVYSTTPAMWKGTDSTLLQEQINKLPKPAFTLEPSGYATIETYTVVYGKTGPTTGIVVGRLLETNERFLATTTTDDIQTLQLMIDQDPAGKRIFVKSYGYGNRFAFTAEHLQVMNPLQVLGLQPSYQYVLVEKRDHMLEVTLNRPEANNALFTEVHEELDQIFNSFEADPELWIAIITGSGTRSFCTGNDLKVTASGKPSWFPKSGFGGLTSRIGRTKPVIAAVNGFAMGGGFEIALACDLVVADSTAQFALSEVRVGLIAGAGGLQRLTRQIPKKVATELILTGRRVGSEEAKQLGFVNVIAEEGKALDKARELAANIMEGSPTSVRLSLKLLNESAAYAAEIDSVTTPYPHVLDELISSTDMMEGVTAFAQKRKPEWKNR